MIKQWLKKSNPLAVFFFTASVSLPIYANEDSTDIHVDFIHTEYVNLVGSAVGSDKYYAADDIKPADDLNRGPRTLIGTLGIESNISGDCTLEFSTQNNFSLRHIVSNELLTNYWLRYNHKNIKKTSNRVMTLPCTNSKKRKLKFLTIGAFTNNVQSGIYRDIITVTVTTQ